MAMKIFILKVTNTYFHFYISKFTTAHSFGSRSMRSVMHFGRTHNYTLATEVCKNQQKPDSQPAQNFWKWLFQKKKKKKKKKIK